jgi:hypothetical protein
MTLRADMANNWNIPDWLEREVRERDNDCMVCRGEFTTLTICPLLLGKISQFRASSEYSSSEDSIFIATIQFNVVV